jgi:hypothetical protein
MFIITYLSCENGTYTFGEGSSESIRETEAKAWAHRTAPPSMERPGPAPETGVKVK